MYCTVLYQRVYNRLNSVYCTVPSVCTVLYLSCVLYCTKRVYCTVPSVCTIGWTLPTVGCLRCLGRVAHRSSLTWLKINTNIIKLVGLLFVYLLTTEIWHKTKLHFTRMSKSNVTSRFFSTDGHFFFTENPEIMPWSCINSQFTIYNQN